MNRGADVGYDMQAIARRMKGLRTERGLDQATLSRISGVSLNLIQQYETGQSAMRLDTAANLAEALGCSIDALLCRG